MKTKPTLTSLISCLALSVFVLSGRNVRGQAYWWWDGNVSIVDSASDNTGTAPTNWLSGGNWDNGVTSAPLGSWNAGDSAIFGGTAASQTITAGTLTIGNMTFGKGPQGATPVGTAYTISGGAITLSAGSIITNNTPTTISSDLSGGSLTKWGAGTLSLSGNNTYTGNTTIGAAWVVAASSTALGSGNVTVGANANLIFASASALTVANNISITPNGTIVSGQAGATGDLTINGTIALNGSGNCYVGSCAGVPSVTLNGRITGAGTLYIYNPYVSTFGLAAVYATATNNDYTGGTIVDNNAWGAYGWGPNSSTVSLYASSLGSGNMDIGDIGSSLLVFMADNIVQPGSILNMHGSAYNQVYFSGVYLNGHSQTVAGLANVGADNSNLLQNNGTNDAMLTVNQNTSTTFNGAISDGSTGKFLLTKAGSGTLTLSGVNTYTGATTVSGGYLVIGGAGQLGGGNYAAAITNNGTFTHASSADQTLSGVISGSGILWNSGPGTLTLSGVNTYTGGTTISGGTLVIGGAGLLGGGSYAAAIANHGAFNYASSASQTLSGVISGSGALIDSGAGTLTLSGVNTYTGATTINAGTLAVAGNGTIGASSNLTIAAGATLDVSGATDGCSLGVGQTLVGTGATGTIIGPLSLNSAALVFTYTNGVPTLNVAGGTLSLSNNPATVTVLGGAPLPIGTYKLISKGAGTVTGIIANSTVVVNGAGALGSASLQILNGELYLNVLGTTPTTTTIASSAATQTYGQAVTFTASVSPAAATGVVTFSEGTTNYGPFALVNGQATLTFGGGSLSAGAYLMSAYFYGDSNYMPGASGVLNQTITPAVLTVAANNVSRWAGNANPLLTASYIGFVAGDTASVLSGSPNLSTTATPASPIGSYPITVTQGTLADTNGNYTFAFTNGTLSVIAGAMPYPQGTAFPLMMYCVGVAAYDANEAAYGWNVAQEYGLGNNSIVNAFLQIAAANSMGGDVPIPTDYDTNGNPVEWPQAQVQAWIQGSMTNNNIAWWDLPEEMLGTASDIQTLQDYQSWVQLYDTNGPRPTYEVTYLTAVPSGIITNMDILDVECYPVGEGLISHAAVRWFVQQAGIQSVTLAGATLGSNYLAGQKTVLADLYCASDTINIYPTPQQSYHDFWSAIASGAQGIAVFDYWDAVNDNPPTLTNNLAQYNLAASQVSGSEIGQAVLFGTQQTNVTFTVTAGPTNTDSFQPGYGLGTWHYPSLNVLCKTWSNNVYVIAVNSTSNSVTADITNLPVASATATLPFELRSVAVGGNGFADTFAPWGVHVL